MTLVADSSATPIIFVDQIVAAEAGTSFEVVGRAAMTREIELRFALVTPGSQVATVGTTREMTIGVSRQPTFPTGTPTVAAVQIGRTNGFAGAVSVVAITDRPGDYQVSFSLSSTTFSGIGMTIMANSGVTTGPHVILLRGTSGLIVHEVSMTVDVTAACITPYPHYPFAVKRPPE